MQCLARTLCGFWVLAWKFPDLERNFEGIGFRWTSEDRGYTSRTTSRTTTSRTLWDPTTSMVSSTCPMPTKFVIFKTYTSSRSIHLPLLSLNTVLLILDIDCSRRTGKRWASSLHPMTIMNCQNWCGLSLNMAALGNGVFSDVGLPVTPERGYTGNLGPFFTPFLNLLSKGVCRKRAGVAEPATFTLWIFLHRRKHHDPHNSTILTYVQ